MRRTYILSVIAIILASLSPAAHAQDAGNADTDDSIEEIIVTGSRIARRDYFSVSPIYSFDDLEIAMSGTNEIYRLLNALPQIDPGANAGANNEPFGSARVNLRSLGDARTLVLLNGRRFAQNGIFGSGIRSPATRHCCGRSSTNACTHSFPRPLSRRFFIRLVVGPVAQ